MPPIPAGETPPPSFWARYVGIGIFLLCLYMSVTLWIKEYHDNRTTLTWTMTEAKADHVELEYRSSRSGSSLFLTHVTIHYTFQDHPYTSIVDLYSEDGHTLGHRIPPTEVQAQLDTMLVQGPAITVYVNPANPSQTRSLNFIKRGSVGWQIFKVSLFFLAAIMLIPDVDTGGKTFIGYLYNKYRRPRTPSGGPIS